MLMAEAAVKDADLDKKVDGPDIEQDDRDAEVEETRVSTLTETQLAALVEQVTVFLAATNEQYPSQHATLACHF